MNLDFVLGKNDGNEPIIVKFRKSPSGVWMEFAEDDRLLRYHSRLKLLPNSKRDYRGFRNINCKFIVKKVLEFYYDFAEDKFKYIENYLNEFQEPIGAERVSSAEDSVEPKLKNLKFNSVHNSIAYFLMKFKSVTKSYSETVQKFYLKKVFPDLPESTFESPIDQVYPQLYLMFEGNDLPFKREYLNFSSEQCLNLKEYLTKLFDYIENIFHELTEKQRIRCAIRRLPETLTSGLHYQHDHRIFNNKRFFIRFLISYGTANNVNLNFRNP